MPALWRSGVRLELSTTRNIPELDRSLVRELKESNLGTDKGDICRGRQKRRIKILGKEDFFVTTVNCCGIWFIYKKKKYHLPLYEEDYKYEDDKRPKEELEKFLTSLVDKKILKPLKKVNMGAFLDIG